MSLNDPPQNNGMQETKLSAAADQPKPPAVATNPRDLEILAADIPTLTEAIEEEPDPYSAASVPVLTEILEDDAPTQSDESTEGFDGENRPLQASSANGESAVASALTTTEPETLAADSAPPLLEEFIIPVESEEQRAEPATDYVPYQTEHADAQTADEASFEAAQAIELNTTDTTSNAADVLSAAATAEVSNRDVSASVAAATEPQTQQSANDFSAKPILQAQVGAGRPDPSFFITRLTGAFLGGPIQNETVDQTAAVSPEQASNPQEEAPQLEASRDNESSVLEDLESHEMETISAEELLQIDDGAASLPQQLVHDLSRPEESAVQADDPIALTENIISGFSHHLQRVLMEQLTPELRQAVEQTLSSTMEEFNTRLETMVRDSVTKEVKRYLKPTLPDPPPDSSPKP